MIELNRDRWQPQSNQNLLRCTRFLIGGWFLPMFIACKEHQMLPGKTIVLLNQPETIRDEFFENLLFAHLVQRLDRNIGVLLAKFCQHQTTAGASDFRIARSMQTGCENSW